MPAAALYPIPARAWAMLLGLAAAALVVVVATVVADLERRPRVFARCLNLAVLFVVGAVAGVILVTLLYLIPASAEGAAR